MKKVTLRDKKSNKVDWQGFVNFTLGKTEKKAIKAMVEDGLDYADILNDWIEDGYSVKVSYDAYSSCPLVAIYGGVDAGKNAGYGMSCRHSDLAIAFGGAWYQHTDMSLDGNEWPKPSSVTSEHDW